MELLRLSLDEFRNSQLSVSGQPYDKIVVGAAIFRYAPDSPSPSILLLKRAAHELYFPNVFELPSGKVDPGDKTLRHALIREVREETGLNIFQVNAILEPMTYSTEKIIVDGAGEGIAVSKSAIQLNFVVSASAGTVTLTADEHSESRWAAEEDLSAMNITVELRVVIQQAFRRVTGT